jgi:hypothetical protein
MRLTIQGLKKIMVRSEMKGNEIPEVIQNDTLMALKQLEKFTKSAGSTRLYSKLNNLVN